MDKRNLGVLSKVFFRLKSSVWYWINPLGGTTVAIYFMKSGDDKTTTQQYLMLWDTATDTATLACKGKSYIVKGQVGLLWFDWGFNEKGCGIKFWWSAVCLCHIPVPRETAVPCDKT